MILASGMSLEAAICSFHQFLSKLVPFSFDYPRGLPPQQVDDTSNGNKMEKLVGLMEKLGPQPSVLPRYHEEYRKQYPGDREGYEALKSQYTYQKMVIMMRFGPYDQGVLQNYGKVDKFLSIRWQLSLNRALLTALCELNCCSPLALDLLSGY